MNANEIAELIVYDCRACLEQLRGTQPPLYYKPVDIGVYRSFIENPEVATQIAPTIKEAIERIATVFESVSFLRNGKFSRITIDDHFSDADVLNGIAIAKQQIIDLFQK